MQSFASNAKITPHIFQFGLIYCFLLVDIMHEPGPKPSRSALPLFLRKEADEEVLYPIIVYFSGVCRYKGKEDVVTCLCFSLP